MHIDKDSVYRTATQQIEALLEGLTDPVAAMACVASVLHQNLDWSSWTGFYRVVADDLLRIGPFQGPIGCVEISFGSGVCGAAARSLRTQLVPDVHAFQDHIACDPSSRSEVVVPVVDRNGKLRAVLDLDSHDLAAFDERDSDALERIADLLAPCFPIGQAV